MQQGGQFDLISIQSIYNTLPDFKADIYIHASLVHCVTKHVAWLFFTLAETFRYPDMLSHYVGLYCIGQHHSLPSLPKHLAWPVPLKATIQSCASFPNPPPFLIHLPGDRWSKGSDKSLTQAYPASASEPTGETCVRGTHFSKYGCVSGSGDSRTVWFLSLDSHQSSAPKDRVFWVQGLPSRDRLFPWFIPSLLSSGLKPAPCRV